jgi:hypothetical protein
VTIAQSSKIIGARTAQCLPILRLRTGWAEGPYGEEHR